MLRLGDFTVEFLGVEYPDYFQDYSAGKYADCCYGIGDTEAEALENCIKQLESVVDFDKDQIYEEYGNADDKITALEEIDYFDDRSDPEFYIGIKFNYLEKERFKRLLKVENLEPLRYESYGATRSEDPLGFIAWQTVIKADGSTSYGDFKSDDWPESAEAYLSNLKDSELYFFVPHASGSDYSGCTITRCNAKCIEDEFEEEWIHTVYGGHNTYAIAVGLTGLLQSDRFDELCEILEGLVDYPCIDDEAFSQFEMEASDEDWDCWAKNDFIRKLEQCYGDCEFEWPDDLRTFFEEKREEANVYWEAEGCGPGMHVDLDEVVDGITFADIEKWAICYRVDYYGLGKVSQFYYSEIEAEERVNELRGHGFLGAFYRRVE